MTITVDAEVRQASDARLSDLWAAGVIDVATVERECARRDAAERAAARQAAERAAWLDAAHADYLRADRDCAGRLFSRAGMDAGIADALSLWRGSESWARRMASEELRNWWDANGRLSLAAYKRQQAMSARARRDERDLDGMPAPSARDLAEQAAAAPRPRPEGSIAGMIHAYGALTRTLTRTRLEAEATMRALQRVNGGIQR